MVELACQFLGPTARTEWSRSLHLEKKTSSEENRHDVHDLIESNNPICFSIIDKPYNPASEKLP
jgi:hypothetical protein